MEANIAQLVTELDQTMTKVLTTFDELDQHEINRVPFENSWTAGQLMKHVLMSNKGFADVMNGPVRDPGRDATMNIDTIRNIFLDFTTKMKSPDFIVPPAKEYDKERLKASFEEVSKRLVDTVEHEDLSKTCTAFELPQMGYLTRIEAAHFVLYHTQRHAHQLEKIKDAIKQTAKLNALN